MAEAKKMLLRLDPLLAERLHAVANIEGRTVSEVVREAIGDHIRRRQQDPKFAGLLQESLVRHRQLLDSLTEDQD